jgi:uncharacterized membrane protein YkvA (DUF1232 family)
MSARDPFPRDRFAATAKRLPAYGRLAWRLAREPLLSKGRRAALVAAAGYLLSPIDAVPGVIPVLGQLDDLLVGFAAIKLALAGLSPAQRQAHLAAVGLDDQTLADDLRTVGATTTWVARATGRSAGKLAGTVARGALTGAKTGLRAAKRVAKSVQTRRRRTGT